MEDKILINYKGIEIEYNEFNDDWRYEVKTGDRVKKTLADAKKNIDDFLKKENAFERVEVYAIDYNKKVETLEVTSLAEETKDGKYWWTSKKGKREKTSGDYLFFKNEANGKILETLRGLSEERKVIQDKINTEFSKMEKFDILP